MYFFLMIVGILGIVDTIASMSYTNMNFGTILPGAVGGVLIVLAYIKLWIRKGQPIISNSILRKLFTAVVILGVLSFVIIESLIIYNSNSQEDIRTDHLIILGAGINGDTVSLTLEKRLRKGINYLNRYPDTQVVVSGGQGIDESISEAEAMKKYLLSYGIDEKRIIEEDKSTSTMENFKLSKEKLLSVTGKDVSRIMIITSDFHMLRAKILAKKNGFEAYGITCETPISVRLNSYAREYFAFIKSYLLD